MHVIAAAAQQQDTWPVAIETIVFVIVIGIVIVAYLKWRR